MRKLVLLFAVISILLSGCKSFNTFSTNYPDNVKWNVQKQPLPIQNLSKASNPNCIDENATLTCSAAESADKGIALSTPFTKEEKVQQVKDYLAKMPQVQKMKDQRREKLMKKVDKMGNMIDKMLPDNRKTVDSPGPYAGNYDADVAFALGVSAIVLVWFLFPIGMILGAAALGMAVRARRKGLSVDSERRATTGLVTGAIALAIGIIPTLILIIVLGVAAMNP